ncbi:hypothetical protein AB0C87_21615 [Actinomadura sp. NPDC048021]|uniref:hypothetical protein n=1 Tax=Actinomadura sp. NPDC048021 TaxID=3155385 RepID=UPI0033DFC073
MMVFVLVVLIAALVLGILVHGLFYLLIIGVIVLVADLAFLGVRSTRRERPLR